MRGRTVERYEVGLIGAGIGASLSPALHEREAAELGLDYALPAARHRASSTRTSASCSSAPARDGYSGLNVTHPCKQDVVAHLDELSAEAAALQAVNTVVFDDGRAIGHNTDATRLRRELRARAAGRARSTSVVAARRRRRGRRGRARRAAARRRAAGDRRRRRRARRGAARDRLGADAPATLDEPRRRRRADPRHADRHGRAPRACRSPRTLLRPEPVGRRGRLPPARDRAAAARARARLPHARRRRDGGASRPPARSSCSPASSPTASGCCATSPSSPSRRRRRADAPLDRHRLPERHARREARGRGARRLRRRRAVRGRPDQLAARRPARSARAPTTLGLTIDLYQPFRDFEAVPRRSSSATCAAPRPSST